jgi:hypothetical protein
MQLTSMRTGRGSKTAQPLSAIARASSANHLPLTPNPLREG